MSLVAIIEYGSGNLDSVARAVEYCGGSPLVTQDAMDLAKASHIILPGVGSFAAAMQNLRARGYQDELNEQVKEKGIPFLGICLGMQLLATLGTESEETNGLGWIEGSVTRLVPQFRQEKIPHMGWNRADHKKGSPLLGGIEPGKDFYFVHSYHFVPKNEADILTTTPYCGEFTSSVARGNIFGVQFHPEKSQRGGFQMLKNFLAM